MTSDDGSAVLSRSWSFLLADLILLSEPASIDRHVVFIHGVQAS